MTAKQLIEHSMKCELLNNRISRIIIYDHVGMSVLTKDSFTWILMEKLKSWLSSNIVQYVAEGFVGFKCNYPGLCSKSSLCESSADSQPCSLEQAGGAATLTSKDAASLLFTSAGDTWKGGAGDTWKGGDGDTWKGGAGDTWKSGDGKGDFFSRLEDEDGPSMILPFLYLGSMKDAQDQKVLRVSWTFNTLSFELS